MKTLLCIALLCQIVFEVNSQPADFYLDCPTNGFTPNEVATLRCTVQGTDVSSANCFASVSRVIVEVVPVSTTPLTKAWSPFPACESDWNHADNNDGRCVNKDASNVYTYDFNITADPTVLAGGTYVRCYAACLDPVTSSNPLTANKSSECGPPVLFVTTTTPPTTAPSATTSTATTSAPSDSLEWWGILLIVVGVIVAIAIIILLVVGLKKHWFCTGEGAREPQNSSGTNQSNGVRMDEKTQPKPST